MNDSDVPSVDSSNWNDFSEAQLHEELRVLRYRYEILLGMGKIQAAQFILKGVHNLEERITQGMNK